MTGFTIIKLLAVAIFLVMFLRQSKLHWGIGLISVTTAVLIDTYLNTFNSEQVLNQLGFFFYVIVGGVLGGTAVWFWGLFHPLTTSQSTRTISLPSPTIQSNGTHQNGVVYNRQLIQEDMQTQFGQEELLDLLFDLDINENDVLTLNPNRNQLIQAIMDWTDEHHLTANLALAVERILTPATAENLPRLEKITPTSPPTILRQYLTTHYSLTQLAEMTGKIPLDWEQIAGDNKKAKVRNLLFILKQRERLPQWIELMKMETAVS